MRTEHDVISTLPCCCFFQIYINNFLIPLGVQYKYIIISTITLLSFDKLLFMLNLLCLSYALILKPCILWNHYYSWGSNFRGFRDSFKLRRLKSNELHFPHWLLPLMFETTDSRTHRSMHFVETTKIGANK